jgi:hypothetical protein
LLSCLSSVVSRTHVCLVRSCLVLSWLVLFSLCFISVDGVRVGVSAYRWKASDEGYLCALVLRFCLSLVYLSLVSLLSLSCLSLVSLLSVVCCLLSVVCCLLSVICYLLSCSRLSLVYCLLSVVSCLLSLASCFLSLVSCLLCLVSVGGEHEHSGWCLISRNAFLKQKKKLTWTWSFFSCYTNNVRNSTDDIIYNLRTIYQVGVILCVSN